MQTTTPMVPAFASIPLGLLNSVSGGCNQPPCCCPPAPQPPAPEPPVPGPNQQLIYNPQFNMQQPPQQQQLSAPPFGGSGGGGDSVSIVINGVPQTGQ